MPHQDPTAAAPFAHAAGLMDTIMSIPDISISLGKAFAEHQGDVEQTADDITLLGRWIKAEPESRAAVLMSLAWLSREGDVPDGAGAAALYARDLHRHARDQNGDHEAFFSTRYPAMPLHGQAGALATSVAFDREDTDISLKTALILLAEARA